MKLAKAKCAEATFAKVKCAKSNFANATFATAKLQIKNMLQMF